MGATADLFATFVCAASVPLCLGCGSYHFFAAALLGPPPILYTLYVHIFMRHAHSYGICWHLLLFARLLWSPFACAIFTTRICRLACGRGAATLIE